MNPKFRYILLSTIPVLGLSHIAPFTVRGVAFKCLAQFMAYCRARLDEEHDNAAAVLAAECSPTDIAVFHQQIAIEPRTPWDAKSGVYCVTGMRALYREHPELMRALLVTDGRSLVYDHFESTWGTGLAPGSAAHSDPALWLGDNRFGDLLMGFRAELATAPLPTAPSLPQRDAFDQALHAGLAEGSIIVA